MKRLFIFNVFLLATAIALAQDMITPVQYIQLYKDIAIREMKRMGVPAAITLAQGILETESGNSELVKKSNNHFGIKCKSNWTGEVVVHDDDANHECFRKYPTAEESYRDHSNFLRSSGRYTFLFNLDVKDYKAWAYGLKKAGYATNPNYPIILIKNIEQYNLQQYTLSAINEVPKFDVNKYEDDKDDSLASTKPNQLAATLPNESILDINNKRMVINGSNCIYANKGSSLLILATRNNIALSKLLSFNELAEDALLTKNQYIYLQKKSKIGNKDFCIAESGETLYDIAQKNGIQLQYLLDYNHFSGKERIEAGKKIYLKPLLISNKSTSSTTYIVKDNETLSAIALKNNISIQQLKEWNNLQTDSLKTGQQLIIIK